MRFSIDRIELRAREARDRRSGAWWNGVSRQRIRRSNNPPIGASGRQSAALSRPSSVAPEGPTDRRVARRNCVNHSAASGDALPRGEKSDDRVDKRLIDRRLSSQFSITGPLRLLIHSKVREVDRRLCLVHALNVLRTRCQPSRALRNRAWPLIQGQESSAFLPTLFRCERHRRLAATRGRCVAGRSADRYRWTEGLFQRDTPLLEPVLRHQSRYRKAPSDRAKTPS